MSMPPASATVGGRPGDEPSPSALAAIAGLLLGSLVLRWVAMALSGASLHVDEAQYWDWSRDLQWGYYSKPPLIAACIAASTALFGDSEAGVRLLATVCWPVTGALLARLALGIARDAAQPQPGHAALWTALVFASSPVAMLLGGVATTDGPLLLAWSTALLGIWLALRERRRVGWALLATAWVIGLMDKYTMAALLPGLSWWAWRQGRWQGLGFCMAAIGCAALLLLPHAAWNWQHGWPTLQHTADITLRASSALDGPFAVASLLALQLIVAGPFTLWILWRTRSMVSAGKWRAWGPAGELMLAAALPLALLCIWQAWRGHVEVNWLAPAHLSLMMAAVWAGTQALGDRTLPWRAGLLQLLLLAAVPAAPALMHDRAQHLGLQAAGSRAWSAADMNARMRGWTQAFERLAGLLPAEAGRPLLLISDSRTLLAQTAYHWRDRSIERAAIAAPGRPRNHYEMACPWQPGMAGGRNAILLTTGPLNEAWGTSFGSAQLLAKAPVQRLGDAPGTVIWMWRLPASARTAPGTVAPRVCR